MNDGCLGLTAVQCTGSKLMATFSDAGDCKIITNEASMYIFDTPILVPHNKKVALPGTWTSEYGSVDSLGLTLDGDSFRNISGSDIIAKVTVQCGWMPFSVIGSSRFLFVARNDSIEDIVLAEYAPSTNSDVAQTGYNVFYFKKEESFRPWVYQNSGQDAYLGMFGPDPTTGLIVPKTTITIEKLFGS